MKLKNRHIIVFICISTTFLFAGCNNQDEPAVYNPELLFKNTFEIKVAPYKYLDPTDSMEYQVSGDTILDTIGAQPTFQISIVPSNITTVAVFTNPVRVSGIQILNPEDIIWQWHSTMDSDIIELDGKNRRRIQYQQGKPVINKKIQYSTQPLPLQSGLYFWAIWSWDNGGRWVLYSSKPFKFRVE